MRVYRNTILALAMAAFMCGCEPPPASEPDEPADQTSDALDVGGVDAMSARRAKPRDTESDRQPVAEKNQAGRLRPAQAGGHSSDREV